MIEKEKRVEILKLAREYGNKYVAQQYNIPFRAWKYISDMADENAAQEWEKNVADGAELFAEKVRNGV